MRSLASIQRVVAIDPIPGADAVEVATVLGWKVVVKKGEFQVGDLAVYFEIDSVPPDDGRFRFLWKDKEQRPNNFRIRTIKLRGQVSQGVLFPLSLFGDHGPWNFPFEGTDVTARIGVTKYEPPLPSGSGQIEGQFFDGVPKTDEERVQSATGQVHLQELTGRPYYITVKCDGASMTVAMHDGEVKVASRNYRLADVEDSPYWVAARNSGLIDFVKSNPWFAVQGELVGPGVQGNKLGLTRPECYIFNVYDRTAGRHLGLGEMRMALDLPHHPEIKMVPVIKAGQSFNYDQDELLALAEGKYEGTSNEREGIVIRSNDNRQPRVSFKAISNRFLLKGGD